MSDRITLEDVARRVGVTKMTVSAALRGVGRVSKVTRSKVVDVARELGYRPNTAARSIRLGRFDCQALLLSSRGFQRTSVQSEMHRGILDALALRDLHLTVSSLPDRILTDESAVPKILRESMADGLLIKYDQMIPERMVELIDEFSIPSVWINSKHKKNCIYPDEFDAGKQATELLLGLGHKRIAYVRHMDMERVHFSTFDRFGGYSAAMIQAGLKPEWIGRYGGDVPRPERLGVMMDLLRRADRPTAILTHGTTSRLTLCAALRLGMSVPGDLSICAVNHELVDDMGLVIDTMVVPVYEIGKQAVAMLAEITDNQAMGLRPIAMKSALVRGGSLSPPKSGG